MRRLWKGVVLAVGAVACTDGPSVVQCTTPRVEGLPDIRTLGVGEVVAVRARVFDSCGAELRPELDVVSSDPAVLRVDRVTLGAPGWPGGPPPRPTAMPLLRAVGPGQAWVEYRHRTLGSVALAQWTIASPPDGAPGAP